MSSSPNSLNQSNDPSGSTKPRNPRFASFLGNKFRSQNKPQRTAEQENDDYIAALLKANQANVAQTAFTPSESYIHQNYADSDIDSFHSLGETSEVNLPETEAAVLPEFRTDLRQTTGARFLAQIIASVVMVAVISVLVLRPALSGENSYAINESRKTSITGEISFGPQTVAEDAVRENRSVAQNVHLIVRGKEEVLTTSNNTVGELLAEKKIKVDSISEGVYPDDDSVLSDGSFVIVDKKTHTIQTYDEDIAFDTTKQEVPSLKEGEQRIAKEGQNGKAHNTYLVTQIGNATLDQFLYSSLTLTQPVNEVVQVGFGVTTPVDDGRSYSSDEIKAWTEKYLASMGLGRDQMLCTDNIFTKESHWNPRAENKNSGAYGIPQALPGSKMSSFGADWQSNYQVQVKWGINYMIRRYGSPCGGWNFWLSHNWY